MTTTTKETKDLSQMTTAELEAYLAVKKKEEKKERERKINAYKKKRDDFIRSRIAKMIELSQELHELKQDTITRGNALHDEMYEVHGDEPKDLKQFSLTSEDGTKRLTLERAERQALDETAEVAIEKIKKVLHERFADRSKTAYKVLNDLLIKNKKGDYDERLVAKLRKHEQDINRKEFSEALDVLAKAYYTAGTSTYARGYVRDDESKEWKHVNIQFSSL